MIERASASARRRTILQPKRLAARATEQIHCAVRIALWWCRDLIGCGANPTSHDGERILLICTACRRVRNAAGEWAPLAEPWWPRPYVLSHGYCPLCFEREYSDLMGERFVARREVGETVHGQRGEMGAPAPPSGQLSAAGEVMAAEGPEARHD